MYRILFTLLLMMTSDVLADHYEPVAARVRVAHYVIDAVDFNVLIDGESAFEAVTFLTTSAYVELETGTYKIEIVPVDDSESLTVTLEADWGHDYNISVIGQVADESLSPLVIDETALVNEVKVPDVEASYAILLHGISNGPAVDFYMDGERLIEGLEFGEYVPIPVTVAPHDIVVSFADDPENVIFENSGETPPSGDFLLLTVMVGSYPDTLDVSGAVTKLPDLTAPDAG